MDPSIHFMMATTLSMIMTLLVYCRLEGTTVDDNLFQNFVVNIERDLIFLMRCPFDNWESEPCYNDEFSSLCIVNDTCTHRFYSLFCTELYIALFIASLIRILQCRYGEIVSKYVEYVRIFMRNVWLITRFCIGLNLSYQVDVLTVYFIVWQFSSTFSKWLSHELPWFSFRLQQGLICLEWSFFAFILHDLVFRYCPFYLKLAILWYYSVTDCYRCLHLHVREYDKLQAEMVIASPAPGCSMFAPGQLYFLEDYDNMELDKNSQGHALGVGDFLCYNSMVLSVLTPFSSIEMKICIGIVCIIFIEIGYMITKWNGLFWSKNKCIPCFPLPVIAFSAYAFLLNVFIEDTNSNLC